MEKRPEPKAEKKAYAKPEVLTYGSMSALTRATATGSAHDGGTGQSMWTM